MLVSLANNPYLPSSVRGGFVRFVRTLYLDRYPQLLCMGRPTIPEQLWVYEVTRADSDLNALPLIREGIKLDEDGSLPGFSIPASHLLHGHADEKLSFPTHTKFFMLRHFSNTYFGGMGGATVHGERDINELTSRLRLFTQSLSMMHPNTTLASLARQSRSWRSCRPCSPTASRAPSPRSSSS